jgi:hypothetical protein
VSAAALRCNPCLDRVIRLAQCKDFARAQIRADSHTHLGMSVTRHSRAGRDARDFAVRSRPWTRPPVQRAPAGGVSPRCPAPWPARGFQCRLPGRRCPACARAGRRAPPWPVGPRERIPQRPGAMPGVHSGVRPGALQPGAHGTVTVGAAAEALPRGPAGGQAGVSDSDPRTLAEYVRHCPKIVRR